MSTMTLDDTVLELDAEGFLKDANQWTESTDVTDYDGLLSSLITQASRMIDRYLGKWPNYFATTDTTIRYYTAFDKLVLDIDEATTVSAVAVSEDGGVASTSYTAWAATDYILEPYNSTDAGEPYRWIEVDTLNGAQSSFFGYPRGVKVTGVFGYSTTPPDDIKRACCAQTVHMFNMDKQAYQNIGAGGNQGSLTYDGGLHPLVKTILQPWKLMSVV